MTALGRTDKRASRRDGIRRRLSRLMNWAGKHWHFENPLRYVDAVSKSELDREKGEIHYHTKAEVEAALKRLPDDYWRAIVASLGYAGLQLAELCWLRAEDVNLKAGTILQFQKRTRDTCSKLRIENESSTCIPSCCFRVCRSS